MFNLIEKFVHFLGWMRFVISPWLLFSIGGGVFYLKYRGNYGTIGGIVISGIGLILGILLAEAVRRKNNTIDVLSHNHRYSQGWRPNLLYHLFSKNRDNEQPPEKKKKTNRK